MPFISKSIDSEIALTKVQRHQFIENMLLEDFPITVVLISTCLNVVLAISSIAFQIVSAVLGTRFYSIYCGYNDHLSNS
jgi:hypothetical protein